MTDNEKKFLIDPKNVPHIMKEYNVTEEDVTVLERYFISIEKNRQLRCQRKGNKYKMETVEVNGDEIKRKSLPITKAEFKIVSKRCKKYIKRRNYQLTEDMKLKIYGPPYEGLVMLDIENADKYPVELPEWIGPEITNTKLGKDGRIIKHTSDEINTIISSLLEDHNREKQTQSQKKRSKSNR